ncbi:uncharacterized protein si:dkey-30c15.13 isoform X2 [Scophthalmus maximus]|uniref:uncharacterized protein si:dkey-30c15.13 isoform X2 n=1 Tax=Scophthalmus maximus TaxID=52904 RepID=UPI0015E0F17A|nr:uncharacterized protein si:dkey-30c15.13 isoform X2 [Scophthalmus maximus]
MMQNMFQEGLYHVFFKETPAACPPAEATDHEELDNVRIHRWFGTVVNTRLLVAGVVQVLSALVCTLATVTHACVSYNCSVSMTTPVWSSLCYVAAGFLAIEVQRRANRLKIITLMALNVFSLLFGFSALLANSLRSTQPVALNTNQQSTYFCCRGEACVATAPPILRPTTGSHRMQMKPMDLYWNKWNLVCEIYNFKISF